MALFLLFLIFFCLLLFNYKTTSNLVVTPGVIFSVSFCVMLFFAFIFQEELEFEVSTLTFFMISVAGSLFVLIDTLYAGKYRNVISRFKKREEYPPIIQVDNWIINLSLVLCLVAIFAAFYIVYINSSGTIIERMKIYRDAYVNGGEIQYRWIFANLYRVLEALVYILGYIFAFNWAVYGLKRFRYKKYLLVFILYIIFTVIGNGARQPTVEIIIYISFIYVFYKFRKSSGQKMYKILSKAGPIAIVGMIIFYYTAQLVGRRKTKYSILQYIAVYLCGGLYYLNLKVGEKPDRKYWGENSFSGIYEFLADKFNLYTDAANSFKEFERYGNTVTMFGDWYLDFGVVGVFIITTFVACLFCNQFYRKVVSKEKHFSRIIYFKMVIALVWAGYDDRIRVLISMRTLTIILLMYVFYKLIIYKKYRFVRR